jgi:hypothetical protein
MERSMGIVITQWALDSYLELKSENVSQLKNTKK